MVGPSVPGYGGRLGEQGEGAGPPDRARELALVPGAGPRDAAGGDLAALRDEVPEPANILVVDQAHPIDAEFANLAASEPAPLDGLRSWRNGLFLLLEPTVLERHLVVAALAACLDRLGDSRGPRGAGLAPPHELHPPGDDLHHAALL